MATPQPGSSDFIGPVRPGSYRPQYGAYAQTPKAAPAPSAPFDMNAMLQAFAQIAQQQQAGQLAQQRDFLRGPSTRLGMSGGVINPDTGATAGNPFDTGFFKTGEQRAAVETERLGEPGFSSLTPGQQSGALSINPNTFVAREAGAIAASPKPFQLSQDTRDLLSGRRPPAMLTKRATPVARGSAYRPPTNVFGA